MGYRLARQSVGTAALAALWMAAETRGGWAWQAVPLGLVVANRGQEVDDSQMVAYYSMVCLAEGAVYYAEEAGGMTMR